MAKRYARQSYTFVHWDNVVRELLDKRDTMIDTKDNFGTRYERLIKLIADLRNEWDTERG